MFRAFVPGDAENAKLHCIRKYKHHDPFPTPLLVASKCSTIRNCFDILYCGRIQADVGFISSSDTEEKESSDGGKTYRAIFSKGDELEWFDT